MNTIRIIVRVLLSTLRARWCLTEARRCRGEEEKFVALFSEARGHITEIECSITRDLLAPARPILSQDV